MLLYEQLSVEGDGQILKSSNDYLVRKGLTTKPVTTDDQHNLCITHSYINCLGWFMKVLYRCHILYECWIEKSTVIGDPIQHAKDRVQVNFKEHGHIFDQVCGANGKGGTSNDGNQASRSFSQKYGEIVVGCVGDKYKNAIRQLHLNLSSILRLISSTGQVDYEKLEVLNKQTSILIASELPWVNINFALPGVLHHSAELIHSIKGWFQKSPLKVIISLCVDTCNNMPGHHPQFTANGCNVKAA